MSKRVLSWLLPAWCLCFALLLGVPYAVYVPDAGQYRLLALGQHSAVPAPFSARILGPAVAGWLGRVTGRGVDTGFLLLGIVCLIALLGLSQQDVDSSLTSARGIPVSQRVNGVRLPVYSSWLI